MSGTANSSNPSANTATEAPRGTLRNRALRTTSQAMVNYIAGYEDFLPEEKLLLLLDKVRLAAIFGGASMINTVEDAPDAPATCNAVGQAICSITNLCTELWEELGGCGQDCEECDNEHGHNHEHRCSQAEKSSAGKDFPGNIPEWRTEGGAEESDVTESGTEEIEPDY